MKEIAQAIFIRARARGAISFVHWFFPMRGGGGATGGGGCSIVRAAFPALTSFSWACCALMVLAIAIFVSSFSFCMRASVAFISSNFCSF